MSGHRLWPGGVVCVECLDPWPCAASAEGVPGCPACGSVIMDDGEFLTCTNWRCDWEDETNPAALYDGGASPR